MYKMRYSLFPSLPTHTIQQRNFQNSKVAVHAVCFSVFSCLLLLLLTIYLKGRITHKEVSWMCWFTPQWQQYLSPDQAVASSLDLCLGLPHGAGAQALGSSTAVFLGVLAGAGTGRAVGT